MILSQPRETRINFIRSWEGGDPRRIWPWTRRVTIVWHQDLGAADKEWSQAFCKYSVDLTESRTRAINFGLFEGYSNLFRVKVSWSLLRCRPFWNSITNNFCRQTPGRQALLRSMPSNARLKPRLWSSYYPFPSKFIHYPGAMRYWVISWGGRIKAALF